MRRVIDCVNAFMVALMFATVFIQIFARVVLGVPTSWTVETGIILFVFVVFGGITTITRGRTHLRVDAVYNLLPVTARRVVDIICSLLYLAFFAAFTYGAYRNISTNWRVETPSIEWFKWGYVYVMIVLTSVIHLAYLFANLVDDIKALGGKA